MASEQRKFIAGFVHMSTDGEVAMVGFADEEYDTKAYVLLVRALSPSPDDVRRGWDDVHITVDDQIHSSYGGLERVSAVRNEVLIEVGDRAAQLLGTGHTIEIDFAKADVDTGELARMLKMVCGDYVPFQVSAGTSEDR